VSQLNAWMAEADPDTVNPIGPDVRSLVFNYGVQFGGDAEFDFMIERLNGNKIVDTDRIKVIAAVGRTRDAAKILDLLEMSLDESDNPTIREQDTDRLYRGIGTSYQGSRLMFQWTEDNYQRILDHFGGISDDLLRFFADSIVSQEELDQYNAFLDKHRDTLGGTLNSLEEGLELADLNIKWTQSFYLDVKDWLIANA